MLTNADPSLGITVNFLNVETDDAGGFAVGVLLHLRTIHSAVFGYLFPVILRTMSMANSLAQLMPLP